MPIPTKISEDQFMQTYAAHEADLRAYGRSLLPNWDSLDDTLQEASIVMWQKVEQLQSINEFLPWAKVILRFQALKTRRKHARDRHVFSDALFDMLAQEGLEQCEDLAAARQLALANCLGKVSAPNRELLLAPYLADQAVVEIAERSGRSVNSLYKLLGRLRTKMRHCVQQSITPETTGATA